MAVLVKFLIRILLRQTSLLIVYFFKHFKLVTKYLNITLAANDTIMPRFLFQPEPIDDYEFYPIPIDIHLGIIKIPTEEILDDFGINTTESMIVETDSNEGLNRIQTAFAREFKRYGKLKESDIRPMDHKTKQVWTKIRRHIKSEPTLENLHKRSKF